MVSLQCLLTTKGGAMLNESRAVWFILFFAANAWGCTRGYILHDRNFIFRYGNRVIKVSYPVFPSIGVIQFGIENIESVWLISLLLMVALYVPSLSSQAPSPGWVKYFYPILFTGDIHPLKSFWSTPSCLLFIIQVYF